MPRNVRNFWLDGSIDGRASRIQGGPVSRVGGFELAVLIRDNGSVTRALTLRGWADDKGNITLDVEGADHALTPIDGGLRVVTRR